MEKEKRIVLKELSNHNMSHPEKFVKSFSDR